MKRITTLFIVLALTFVSASAFAKQSDALIEHVPHDSRIIVGMEIPALKKSFLFDEVLEVLLDRAADKSILSFVLDSGGVDAKNNVDSMLVAFDEAPTNPQAPQTPATVIVLEGKMKTDQILTAAKTKFGELKKTTKGELEVYSASGVDLAFVAKDVLVIADQGKYARDTWKAAADPKKSAKANKDLTSVMGLIPAGKGLWVAMETKGLSAATPQSPAMDGAAMTVDVASGVALDFRSKFQKEKDATDALKQFQEMKKQSGNDPLIAMLGAKPLLDNLDAKVEKKTVLAMKTSMTDTQLKAMIARLKAMNQAPPPATGPPNGPTSGPTSDPTAKPPTGKGANADFN